MNTENTPRKGTTRWYQARIKELEASLTATAERLNISTLSVRNATEERDRALGEVKRLTKDRDSARQAAQWAEELLKACSEELDGTPWEGDSISDVPTRVSGLRYGYKLALSDAEHISKLHADTAAVLTQSYNSLKAQEERIVQLEALQAEALKSLKAARADLTSKIYELATLRTEQAERLPALVFWFPVVVMVAVVASVAYRAGVQIGAMR